MKKAFELHEINAALRNTYDGIFSGQGCMENPFNGVCAREHRLLVCLSTFLQRTNELLEGGVTFVNPTPRTELDGSSTCGNYPITIVRDFRAHCGHLLNRKHPTPDAHYATRDTNNTYARHTDMSARSIGCAKALPCGLRGLIGLDANEQYRIEKFFVRRQEMRIYGNYASISSTTNPRFCSFNSHLERFETGKRVPLRSWMKSVHEHYNRQVPLRISARLCAHTNGGAPASSNHFCKSHARTLTSSQPPWYLIALSTSMFRAIDGLFGRGYRNVSRCTLRAECSARAINAPEILLPLCQFLVLGRIAKSFDYGRRFVNYLIVFAKDRLRVGSNYPSTIINRSDIHREVPCKKYRLPLEAIPLRTGRQHVVKTRL